MLLDSTNRCLVYLIEDDADLREETTFNLSELGFVVKGFGNGPDFFRALLARRCDIAVIDVGLPGEDGFSIATHLRTTSTMGIVMLTACSALEDRLQGLQRGADAYLVKPVDMRELAATVQAVMRRLAMADAAEPVAPGAWQLADQGWTLLDPSGRKMALTPTERLFLQCLFESLGQPVSRDSLIQALGGDAFDFDPHRIDSMASRLRRKTAEAGMQLNLRSVRNAGYVLVA